MKDFNEYLNTCKTESERAAVIALAMAEMAKQDLMRGDYEAAAKGFREVAELLDDLPKAMLVEAAALQKQK